MTNEAYANGPSGYGDGACGRAFRGGPPWPMKLVAVGAAFLICRPLGLAVLAFMLIKAARRHWGRGGFEGFKGFGGPRDFGFRRPSGNSAFDQKRKETLDALAEEEKAFSDFEQRQREARDREAFERFVAERGAKGQP